MTVDRYLPECAGTAVLEMLGLDLRGRMLREEFLLTYSDNIDELEERLVVLRIALDDSLDDGIDA